MKGKILFYSSLVSIAVGFVCFFMAFFFKGETQDALLTTASILGVLGITLNIVKLVVDIPKDPQRPVEKKIVVVDVKDIPKSKEEKLYEQYENLYKQNLITKEDLDKKRKELIEK